MAGGHLLAGGRQEPVHHRARQVRAGGAARYQHGTRQHQHVILREHHADLAAGGLARQRVRPQDVVGQVHLVVLAGVQQQGGGGRQAHADLPHGVGQPPEVRRHQLILLGQQVAHAAGGNVVGADAALQAGLLAFQQPQQTITAGSNVKP
ncbi:hypothetical protein G6F59_016658 [Rhizopus arrhizus]|nr:hypothetical protein G6F59_016658 [Rhizopus arrhizus]